MAVLAAGARPPGAGRVLFIGYVWPEPNSSAAGGHMLSLVRLFLSRGWRVSFASPAAAGEHRFDLPAIGVDERPIALTCSSFDRYVEYALRTAMRPLGVATHTVVPQLPEDYRNDLPSPEQIAERLRAWEACGGRSTDEIR